MTETRRDTTWAVVFRLDRSTDWLEWGTGHPTAPDAVRAAEVLVKLPVVKDIRFDRTTRQTDRFSLSELDTAADQAALRERIAMTLARTKLRPPYLHCLAMADAVLAELPDAADRAAVEAERDSLGREADRLRKGWVEMRARAERAEADRVTVLNAAAQHLYTALFPAVYDDMGQKAAEGVNRAVSELRRMAAEARQDGAQQ